MTDSIWNIRRYGAIWAILLACVLVEAWLDAADFGLLETRQLRLLAYQYGGFWAGLLGNWRPNYAAQPYLMFVTYGFLHGGVSHLTVNMLTLFALGRPVILRVGQAKFLLLYFLSMFGGALGFALLSNSYQPMVGASGALFGLAGAIGAWEYVDRFHAQLRLWPVLRMVGWLILLNAVFWWAMNGRLAWETHLGGFVAGWVAALLLDPRSRPIPQ